MSGPRIRIRQACRRDLRALLVMQARSVRELAGRYYRAEAIDGLIRQIGTVDGALIDEGHYYVAVVANGRIVGSGGWSRQSIGDDDRAVLRSVYVAPDLARQGIASALVRHAEATAAAAGIRHIDLSASLPGVPLYRALGYRVLHCWQLECGADVKLDSVEMTKQLHGKADAAAGGLAALTPAVRG